MFYTPTFLPAIQDVSFSGGGSELISSEFPVFFPRNTLEVKQSSVIAYYEWVGQVKDTYRRKVLVKVLDVYLIQTDEILNKSEKDIVLIALEKDYRVLKNQKAMLTNDNALLSSQLTEKKALRTNQ